MKWFKWIVLSFLSLLVFATLLLETPPGKQIVKSALLYALKSSGIAIETEELSGAFPKEFDAKNVRLPDWGLSIEKLHIELSLASLLAGEIDIVQLDAEGIRMEKRPSRKGKRSYMAIAVRAFRLSDVLIEEYPPFDASGSGGLTRFGSVYFNAAVKRLDVPEAAFHVEGSVRSSGKMDIALSVSSPTLAALKPWVNEEAAEGSLTAEAHVKGTPSEFTGKISGKFHGTKTGVLPLDLFTRDWAFHGRASKSVGEPIRIQKLVASTQGMRLQGSASLDRMNELDKAQLYLRADLGSLPLPLKGVLNATGHIEKALNGWDVAVSWNCPKLEIERFELDAAKGTISGLLGERFFLGRTEASAQFLNEPWEAETSIAYRQELPLLLDDIRIDSPRLHAAGNLARRPDQVWIGKLTASYADVSLAQKLWDLPLSGIASGSISFEERGTSINASGKNISYGEISAASADFAGNLRDFSARLAEVRWHRFALDAAQVQATDGNFELATQGTLQLNAAGSYRLENKSLALSVQSASGQLSGHPLELLEPVSIDWTPSQFSANPLKLSYGSGTIDGSYSYSASGADATIAAQAIPLDILSLYPLQAKVQGTFDAKAALHQRGSNTDAEWTFAVQNGFLQSEGAPSLSASANCEGTLHNGQLRTSGSFTAKGRQMLAFDLDIPQSGAISGTLSAHGDMEDLLDFFNLGMHRIEGSIACDLQMRRGSLQGACRIIDGHYQNYLTGTELTHIAANFEGRGDALVLTSLTAQDVPKKGELTARGEIQLSLPRRFPFHFETAFTRLNIVQIDLVSAEAEGSVSIEGNLDSALAKGHIQIVESDISIPNHIPRSLPDLQVIYKNRPLFTLPAPAPKLPYPLNLDLTIAAPEGIYIEGRGISSEWKGQFAIGGTYAEPSADGKLELLHGEFSFAGRIFKLSDGSLTMQGNQYKMPRLDIAATTTEKGIAITARLRGPLNRPQLTFQSVPPLPLSSILSYLLFGKDLSDVNGLQALQLAGTVASVAGEGPDIMEFTRKSLGVDRLQIVMTPTKTGEGYNQETVALQVGKIITPGLLVTVKQGANDSAPDIGIEIDLTHGFTFGAESEQQPPQGKFSLNWNLNY